MENKVVLYDSNNIKVGDTFARRARQLVKQQRATWIDDNHDAIRFAPDMDNMEYFEKYDEPENAEKVAVSDDKWLVALAEKRLFRRKLFIIHSIALVPVACLFMVFSLMLYEIIPHVLAGMFLGSTVGSWATLFLVHAVIYIIDRQKIGSVSRSERSRKALAAEIDLLKSSFVQKGSLVHNF